MFLILPHAKQQLLSWLKHPQQQSARLRQAVDRIRSSLELKVVLQTAVDEVGQLLELDRCSFLWYFQDTQRVQVVCEWLRQPHSPSQLGYHPLEKFGSVAGAIAKGETIIQTGTHASENWDLISRLFQLGYRSRSGSGERLLNTAANLWVPLQADAEWIGFIACGCDARSNFWGRSSARRWSEAEIEFISAIAQQLEIAIAQARLYEQTQKSAQREKLVNQITNQTRQSFNLETILTEAIAHLLEAMQADRCLVHLVGEASSQHAESLHLQEVKTSLGMPAYQYKHLYEVCRPPFTPSLEEFETSGPITEWVIRHSQPVAISDVSQDRRIGTHNPEYQSAQIKSSLVVPVKANGQLHAILYLNQCAYNRFWSKNDRELAIAVADQLAISIQQAHLYGQIQHQATQSAAQAEHLSTTLKQLQLTQAQLIQSEKMSSLGQLVAGIAHEINNPVSFIYGNIPYVKWYVNDLIRVVKAYQERYPHPEAGIQQILEEIELDFLERDLPQLLSSMTAGAERIREIVLSLRNFSRLDESQRKIADLHEGLESTLLLLQGHFLPSGSAPLEYQSWRYTQPARATSPSAVAEAIAPVPLSIQVVRQYGEIPPVECYPGQLNQVFMNLLMNAVEAMQECPAEDRAITIRTGVENRAEGDWVVVAIADNGSGIPAEIQAKIFDPFFTTKGVGEGTGLGLTISYQVVVNQHRGQLLCVSQLGNGTEMQVKIPVQPLN
ncbi:MAG: GAF domain-containing protein [Desertifilum sp.]|nr:GAF domain-containing protein [Desertifilum sp.]